MKTVILAVLLLLAVASIVSEDTPTTCIVSDDTTKSGNATEIGKSWYGDETCLPVISQNLQLYKFVFCLITSCAMTYGEMQVKLQAF